MALDRIPSLLAVLNAVRWSPGTTAAAVADHLGLGRSVVGQRVVELERAGLVRAEGRAPSTGGRAARRLVQVAAAGVVVAGVEIGPAGIVVLLATTDGEVVAEARSETDLRQHPDAVLDQVVRLLRGLVAGQDGRLLAVGVALQMPVSAHDGRPVAPPGLPAWDEHPLRDLLARELDVPVSVDNDVHLRLLAELRQREAARSARTVLYLQVASGVGAAVAMGGTLHRGATGAAGDIGHIQVPHGGMAVCRCGRIGCLAALVGVDAVVRDARVLAESGQSPALAAALARGGLSALDVTEAAEAGDASALALYARVASLLGTTLSTLVSMINPDLVVLGGAAVRGGAFLVEPIRAAVAAGALDLTLRDLRIAVTTIEDGPARGAVELAADQLFTAAHVAALLPVEVDPGDPST